MTSHQAFAVTLSAYEFAPFRLERLVRTLSEIEYCLRTNPDLFLITRLHEDRGRLTVTYRAKPSAQLRRRVAACWSDVGVDHVVEAVS